MPSRLLLQILQPGWQIGFCDVAQVHVIGARTQSAQLPQTALLTWSQAADQELADFGAAALFFLLLVALPTGSYYLLHRGLVGHFRHLSAEVQEQSRQVRRLCC